MRVRKLLALTLAMMLVLSSFTFAFANTKYDLEGYTLDPNEKWTDGIIKGWNEGDWVPFKISVEDYDGSNITVRHEYLLSNTINGFDMTDNWEIGSYSEGNGFSVSGPTVVTGSNTDLIEYVIELDQLTKDALIGNDFTLYWEAHLSITGGPDLIDGGTVNQGPSFWTGASLQTRFVEAAQTISMMGVGEFNYGSITIDKDVLGIDDSTTFDVNVTGPEGYSETVTIGEDLDPVILDNLLYGTYTLTEVDDDNYIMDDPETVVVEEENLSHTVTFENTLKTYEMTISKSASPTNIQLGGEITYTITVENTGNQDLTGIELSDTKFDLSSYSNFDLDVGETMSITYSYITVEDDLVLLENIVTAIDDMAGTVTDSAIVNVTEDPTGSITFMKDVINLVEDTTPFMFHVSGPNNYGAYTQVFDDDSTPLVLDDLALGTYTFYEEVPEGYTGLTTTGSITLTALDGELNQSFTFENERDFGALTIQKEVWIDEVEDTDNDTIFTFTVNGETVTASAITPGQIELPVDTYVVEETGYGDFIPETVTQQAVVTTEGKTLTFVNNYTTPPVTGSVTVYKEIIGEQVGDGFNFRLYRGDALPDNLDNPDYIEAETSVNINEPEYIDGLEAGWYTIAEDPDITGYILPYPITFYLDDGEDASVTLQNIEVPLKITKTVDDDYVRTNENVTYTITVENTSDFIDLYDVVVEDENLSYSTTLTSLSAGGVFTHNITTSYSSEGTKVNTAKASTYYEHPELDNVRDGEGQYIEVQDSATVVVNRRPPSNNTYRMTIDKVADGNFYDVGDTIEYTITVRNTGNSTLTNVLVTDDMTGLEETIDFLNPGASEEFITTYETQTEDIGDLTNTATAEDDRAGTEEDDVTVNVEGVPEGVPEYTMTIEKTAMVEGDILMGDMVEFEIVVTNTGEETIENILVEDKMVKFEAVIDELAPGDSKEFTVNVEAKKPGPLENIATATSTETGTVEDGDIIIVVEPTPQAVPDTGVAPTDLFFGLGALVSGLGVYITKKRK